MYMCGLVFAGTDQQVLLQQHDVYVVYVCIGATSLAGPPHQVRFFCGLLRACALVVGRLYPANSLAVVQRALSDAA